LSWPSRTTGSIGAWMNKVRVARTIVVRDEMTQPLRANLHLLQDERVLLPHPPDAIGPDGGGRAEGGGEFIDGAAHAPRAAVIAIDSVVVPREQAAGLDLGPPGDDVGLNRFVQVIAIQEREIE